MSRLTREQRRMFTELRGFSDTASFPTGHHDTELNAITAAAAELSSAYGAPSAVVGLGERAVVPAAVLRSIYGAPGTDLQTALLCRDRSDLRRAAHAAHIRVARVWNMNDSTAPNVLASMAAVSDGPFVLTPRHLAGSLGPHVFEDIRELATYVEHQGLEDDVEIEDFVTGDIIHLEGVVRENEIVFLSASRCMTARALFEDNRAPLAFVRLSDDAEVSRAYEFARATTNATGLRDSVFHYEAIATHSDLVLTEVLATVGGAAVRQHIHATYGVDLVQEAYLACVARPSHVRPHNSTPRCAASGWIMTPLPSNGRFVVVKNPDFDAPPGVIWSDLPAPGDILDTSHTLVSTGTFVFTGRTVEEVRAKIDFIVEHYTVA